MVRPRKSINPGPLGETEGLGPSRQPFTKGRYTPVRHGPPAASPDEGTEGQAPPDLPPVSKFAARATASALPTPDPPRVDARPVREQEPAARPSGPEEPPISFTIDLNAVEESEPSEKPETEDDTYYSRHRAKLPGLGLEPADRDEDSGESPMPWALLYYRKKRR